MADGDAGDTRSVLFSDVDVEVVTIARRRGIEISCGLEGLDVTVFVSFLARQYAHH